MGSKQLQSILKNIPSATVQGEDKIIKENNKESHEIYSQTQVIIPEKKMVITQERPSQKQEEKEEYERIVAVIPRSLKRAIRLHLQENKGLTEKGVILKSLALYGFKIDESWLIDKRTTR